MNTGIWIKTIIFSLILSSVSWASSTLKVGSFNIRNFTSSPLMLAQAKSISSGTNLRLLKEIITSTQADLLAVQEILDVESFKTFINNNFPAYQVVLSECGGRGEQKLGFIYNSNKLEMEEIVEDLRVNVYGTCDTGVRPAMIGHFKNKENNNKFAALSLHLKAGPKQRSVEVREQQHQVISKIIKELRNKGQDKIMLMGDLNTVNFLSGNRSYREFSDFVQHNGLQNFSEELGCTSYWSGRDRTDDNSERSILDHVMISHEIAEELSYSHVDIHSHCKKVSCSQSVETALLGQTYREVSDHCPVVATLVK